MIETARLRLRSWRDDDRDWYAAQCACPVVMAHLGGPKPRAECDARIDRMMTRQVAGEPAFRLVERLSDGVRIGDAGLKRIDSPGAPDLPDTLEIGWRFARDAWGQGYAHEAATAALAEAFGRWRAVRVAAFTSAGNTASWRLMQRLGMTRRPDLDFTDPRFPPADQPTIAHVLDRTE